MKKYKILCVLFCVVISIQTLVGCTTVKNETNHNQYQTGKIKKEEIKEKTNNEKHTLLPGKYPMELVFSSGAGGWMTEISLEADGSFVGKYHDSEMGSSGEGYDGTVYICDFNGKFGNITKLDNYTYYMTLENMNITSEESGNEYIKERVKYIASDPYGMEDGEKYMFYLPQTPVDVVNEEFLNWWPYRFDYDNESKTTLTVYGIYNIKKGYGFFSN